jgi:membrane fusion protein, multidrug efflux system
MPQVAEAPEVEAPKTEAPKVQVLVARPVKSNRARWILSLVLLVALVGGVYSWLHSQAFESTDDAQIEGHLDLISPRISGTVAYINPKVENNQVVAAGTLLLELDPRD